VANSAPSFELPYEVVNLSDCQALRLWVRLLFEVPDNGDRIAMDFRIDTGADVSMIPGNLWNPAIQPLTNWPPGVDFRTASGTVLPARRAVGVRFRFLPLLSEVFRTDFAIATGVVADYGLLAWRDLALDFDIRSSQTPRLFPDGESLALPGVLRLTLRSDRFPVRVG
jgi:hypothetical protein